MDNFDRNVWCLLGLPFDAVDLETTVYKVHKAAKNKTPLFISTPNLNFLIASQKDEKFRNSVINSNISIADGKPIIWLARLLNIPLPERVAGSDLIESLIENKKGYKPLKVFFFGGEEGVAHQACEKLNSENKGLQCVGFFNPGFGSVEDMSSSEIIDKINQSNADFVIVSLGANKGQAWIECNKDKLNSPIISHLGAVVNFIAGNVKRAPKIIQRLGFEWVWRIKEEPVLFIRYFKDGIAFTRLFVFKILPLYLLYKNTNNKETADNIILQVTDDKDIFEKSIIHLNNDSELNNFFRKILISNKSITMNIESKGCINSNLLGKIILLKKELKVINSSLIVKVSPRTSEKFFHSYCCEDLLIR
ncbi:MAG: WecB/TagA/CpsF family glycosyltransferase [Pseudomonadota bacterium]